MQGNIIHVRENLFFSEIYSAPQNKMVSSEVKFSKIYNAPQNEMVNEVDFSNMQYSQKLNGTERQLLVNKQCLPI